MQLSAGCGAICFCLTLQINDMRHQVLFNLLAKDKQMVAYRPEFRSLTGSVTSAILLQQIFYRWSQVGQKPFYKFKAPCNHPSYKDGDSWTEELGFSSGEFDTALSRIAVKVKKNGDRPGSALVWYYVDNNRMTFYEINESAFLDALEKIYEGKFDEVGKKEFSRDENGRFIPVKRDSRFTPVNGDSRFTKNGIPDLRKTGNPIYLHISTENTTEITTEMPPSGAPFDKNDIKDFEEQIGNSPIETFSIPAGEAEKKEKSCAKKEKEAERVAEVVEYLNHACGKNFKAETSETRRLVGARLKAYPVQDLKDVIDLKTAQWGKDAKMREYLRPQTLFAESNFEGYLQSVKDHKSGIINLSENGKKSNGRNGHNLDPERTRYMESLLDGDEQLDKIKRMGWTGSI